MKIVAPVPQQINGNFNLSKQTSFRSENVKPVILTQEKQLKDYIAKQEKEAQKEKTKSNLTWILGIGASLAIILMALGSIRGRRDITKNNIYIPPTEPGKKPESFRDLLFKPLKEKYNNPTGEATPPKLRRYFSELLKARKTDKEVIKYIGPLANNLPNRAVIYGGAGVGKTYGIKAYASKIGAEYVERDFSKVSSKYIGETSVFITKDFVNAKKIAMENPNKTFVLVYNEVDSLMPDPSKISSEAQHLIQNRTAFLDGLDSIKDVPNIQVFATTNFNPAKGGLDRTSLQRLGRIIEAELPTAKGLEEALKFHLRDLNNADVFFKEQADDIVKLTQRMANEKRTHRDVENMVADSIMKYQNELTSLKEQGKDWKQKFSVKYLEDALKDLGVAVNDIKTNGF